MSEDEYWFEVERERIVIDGVEYELENSLHVIDDGIEYVDIDGELYELEHDSNYSPDLGREIAEEGGSILSSIFNIAIILIIGFVLSKGILFALDMPNSDELTSATGDISEVIVTGSKDAVNRNDRLVAPKTPYPTPRATKKPSATSQQADKIVEAMDYTNPTTRDFALMQIDKSHGGSYNIAQICDVWEKIYNRWTYVNDPRGFEYFSPASRTIDIGLKGDCDDFAIVIGSVMQSIGGYPRIMVARNSDGAGHAYAEVQLASNKKGLQDAGNYICKRYHCSSIAYHTTYSSNGDPIYWLNLDWQSRHPGGKFWDNSGETLAVYPNGYVEKYK